ncbi:MAG: hypothetical protein IGQ88_03350 [Gloeomargaritaceae cyanobacterium C42_A2020_066]|nr:hypothetical protein [Gloeomargaritaceae cyanobacterium C42_A2020_066]
MLGIGFPRGIVDRIPTSQVIAWVDADPDERASLVAKLVINDFSSDETLASRIVGAYGDRVEVASALRSEYMSGVVWGSASTHWEKLATSVEEATKHTKLPKLWRWATDVARVLRMMAEGERQWEAERDLRWD